MPQQTIFIIGAGVLGLSTAITLQCRLPSHRIIIIAAELPTDTNPSADYSSVWAGAHYRPIPRSTRQLEDEADMAMRTANVMFEFANSYSEEEVGVGRRAGVEYLEKLSEEVKKLKTGDLYAGPGDGFRVLGREELPVGVQWGCEYGSYCVNVPVYLRWLMRKFQEGGGRILKSRLNGVGHAWELAESMKLGKVVCFVNCSGRNFDRDEKMKIIRGQTVLVKQEYDKTVTRQCRDGSWSFLIPRPGGGGTIVGGTKEVGDWSEDVSVDGRKRLLEAAAECFPDFLRSVEDFVVVKDNVGRRPWREGGLRIEAEADASGRRIVHGYGAAGRGYELSWGAAERIADLVAESVPSRASL
jgi:D-amino-acid oxidase